MTTIQIQENLFPYKQVLHNRKFVWFRIFFRCEIVTNLNQNWPEGGQNTHTHSLLLLLPSSFFASNIIFFLSTADRIVRTKKKRIGKFIFIFIFIFPIKYVNIFKYTLEMDGFEHAHKNYIYEIYIETKRTNDELKS